MNASVLTALVAVAAIGCQSVEPQAWTASTEVEGQAAEPADARWTSSLKFLLGYRALDETDWEPTEDHVAFGLEADVGPAGSILGFELGTQFSLGQGSLSDVDFSSSIFEFYGGPRLTFFADSPSGFRPYVGGGLTLMLAEIEGSVGFLTARDDDFSVGGYAHGGLYYHFQSGFELGLDVRGVFGTSLSYGAASVDADYWQVSLLSGAAW